jgi:hypothetical protein
MFFLEPVDRLSRIVTLSPRAMRASARCEPIKPAPPVMRTCITSVYRLTVKYWKIPGNPPLSVSPWKQKKLKFLLSGTESIHILTLIL